MPAYQTCPKCHRFTAILPFKFCPECSAEEERVTLTPAHYDKAVTPWDLERCMESSGNAFVDSRRTDVLEYVFRIKDNNLLGDLRKAQHCISVAIEELEKTQKP